MFADTTRNHQGRRERTLVVLIVALLAGYYCLTAGAPDFRREPDGYYNLQTLGFFQGHLYAAVEPHPGLLALPDPYDPVANAPYRVHDMTFWQGKYYLYFGVAPVLLLFLPVRILTGYFVTEPTAVALFVSLGLIFTALTLSGMRRRLFPRASPWILLLLVATQGIAGPTVLLTQSAQFYQVPISCAYALSMAGLWCLQRLLEAEPTHRWRWMGMAGTCFGLTLAARPNYILATGLLAVPVWWCWREAGLSKAPWKKQLPLALLAYGPVAAAGTGLLLFNWARFGQFTEFGMRYQLAGQSFVDFTPLGWKYLAPHFAEYAWGKIGWQSYFPFLDLGPEAPYGVLRYLPLTWLGVLACWPRRLPGEADASGRLMLAATIALLGVANLLMNSVFFFEPVSRYMCDFAPALILLGALGGLALAHILPGWRLGPLLVGVLAVWSMGVTAGVFVYRLPAASYPAGLARLANRGVGLVERLRGKHHGGIRLAVQLPAARKTAVEPIFQTGIKADRRNMLQLHYRNGERAQLGFFHAGLGELLSDEFALPANGRLMIDVYCSAFLPPDSHPMYDGWPAEVIAAARSKLEIKVEGRTVLAAALPCYPSSRGDLLLGRVGFLPFAENLVFAGKVTLVQELAYERERLPARELTGITVPQSLRIQLPAHLGHGYEPLITTGEAGRGEMLYAVYHPEHKVQFGLESWGRGAVLSQLVAFDPAKSQTMTVWLGSWGSGDEGKTGASIRTVQPGSRRLYVKFNGVVVFDAEREFFPGKGSPTGLGWNRIGAISAEATFSGRILSIGAAEPGAVPDLVPTGSYGMVDVWVNLPKSALGRTEPLVVTGEPGAGDALFIKYLDGQHVEFRHDHWGRGGMTSRPVPMNYEESAHIEINLGSLQAQRNGYWSRRLWLRVNGQQLFDDATDFYPAQPDQISLGLNSIGFSNCEPGFTGQILGVKRPAVPR